MVSRGDVKLGMVPRSPGNGSYISGLRRVVITPSAHFRALQTAFIIGVGLQRSETRIGHHQTD